MEQVWRSSSSVWGPRQYPGTMAQYLITRYQLAYIYISLAMASTLDQCAVCPGSSWPSMWQAGLIQRLRICEPPLGSHALLWSKQPWQCWTFGVSEVWGAGGFRGIELACTMRDL